jgi:hypothetical protein
MEFVMLKQKGLLGLMVAGFGLGMVMPVRAQQVVLTPMGTMIVPAAPKAVPVVNTAPMSETPSASSPESEPTPEAPVSALPSAPPTQDGQYAPGTLVPGFMGAKWIAIGNNDPRIPEGLRGVALAEGMYWAVSPNPTNPDDSISMPPILFSGSQTLFGRAENQVAILDWIQEIRTIQDAQTYLQTPIAKQVQELQRSIILSDPERYSFNPATWGKPVKDVLDAQGNVVISKQQIMSRRLQKASGGLMTMEFTQVDAYEQLGFIPERMAEFSQDKLKFPTIVESVRFYRQLASEKGLTMTPASFTATSAMGQSASNIIVGDRVSLTSAPSLIPLQGLSATATPVESNAVTNGFSVVSQPENAIVNVADRPVFSIAAPASDSAVIPFSKTNGNLRLMPSIDHASPLSASRILPDLR